MKNIFVFIFSYHNFLQRTGPSCFSDPSISMGGERCPADTGDHDRVDCHPEPGASQEKCVSRGCHWCVSSIPDVPWCFLPKTHGYRRSGDVVSTTKGYRY